MTIAQAIAIASKPDTHIVLGVRLKPFCIGHWFSLIANDVSFISGKDHTLPDLIFSALVCSQTHHNFLSVVEAGGFGKSVSKWGHRLSGGFIGVWKRRAKRAIGRRIEINEITGFDFNGECAKFQNYLDTMGATQNVVNEWCRPITHSLSKEKPHRMAAPEMVLILNLLTSELGFSEMDALNMPLPLARWKIAVHAERKGAVRISTQAEEKDVQDFANETLRKYKSGELKFE